MVELVQHDSRWAALFSEERESLMRTLGGIVDEVEHIGSTAVPGLLAKPVIDLAARTAAGADPFGLASALAPLCYQQHRSGPTNHGVYVRTADGVRTHILHVFAADDWDTCPQRLFRDALIRDPVARERYAARKAGLAATTTDGRDYTAGKQQLVEEIVNGERTRRGLAPTRVWDK